MALRWGELFPSRLSFVVFISYMALFVNQGILVTASQNEDKKYGYNTTMVVLLTEVLKLIISIGLYCRKNTLKSMMAVISENMNLLALYFVPSLLYCFYNNLSFLNLSLFDPTSYYLLLQFRVVITALLFQVIFKKYLNGRQWFALILLTFGCMIKHIDTGGSKSNLSALHSILSFSAILIVIQSFCSSLAGVYNEYLLKSKGLTVDIYVQNVFMYVDSIVCNIVIFALDAKTFNEMTLSSLKSIFHINVLLIMLNSALIGVVTSFFLKTLNSILKTFASALELIFTAIACYLIFGIPISNYTVLSILVVSVAVVIYSQSPVVNQPKAPEQDQVRLLDEGEAV